MAFNFIENHLNYEGKGHGTKKAFIDCQVIILRQQQYWLWQADSVKEVVHNLDLLHIDGSLH